MTQGGPYDRLTKLVFPLRSDLFGFALSRAWSTVLLAHAASGFWSSGASFALQTALYLCAALGAAGLALLSTAGGLPAQDNRRMRRAVTLAGVVGTISIAMGGQAGIFPLVLAGGIIAGGCAGWLETAWGARFASLEASRIQTYTLLMTAAAALAGIVFGMLPGVWCLVIATALCAGSIALLSRQSDTSASTSSHDGIPSQTYTEQIPDQQRRALLTIILCCLIFSTIYNLVVTLTYRSFPAETLSSLRFAANLVCAVGLLALVVGLRPLRSAQLLRLILPVTAIGFVLFLVAPPQLALLALALSGIGRKLFDILTWILVTQAVQTHFLSPNRPFGLLIIGKNLGYFAGLALATFIVGQGPNAIQAATVLPILLLALIVCFSWLFPERTIDQLFGVAGTDATDADAPDLAVGTAVLADTCNLTPREREVLDLLAKGRTQAVIAQKLGISTGTAHSHIIHIYQKTGVNKQQELIEKVEFAGRVH